MNSAREPRAAIIGISGASLTDLEAQLLREFQPLGVILFLRNVQDRRQLRSLTAAIRACLGRDDAPILIDQEGGRVQRLRPPEWLDYPPLAAVGSVYDQDPAAGLAFSEWLGAAIGYDLAEVGISVVCAPVLDLLTPDGHSVIGDRAFHRDPAIVTRLAGAMASGFRSAGVVAILKHIPGHGRATADSHHSLPVVATSLEDLFSTDFSPFREVTDRDRAWAMTAHIVYTAADGQQALTLSAAAIDALVRRAIGFEGLVISDDLSMRALQGSLGDLTRLALAAGCDCVLQCSGTLAESREVLAAARPLTAQAVARLRFSQVTAAERRQFSHPESRATILADYARRFRLTLNDQHRDPTA
ncbi:MAG: beta-N-acetylhexosaminidase [Alphaproteobacteria bacterium]|nr:beta-N-acetylhexosaminidase [Alphaproteobacteria bacterium]